MSQAELLRREKMTMSSLQINIVTGVDLDNSPLQSASGMPLTTIPELPGDEYECEDEYINAERERALFTEDTLILTSTDSSEVASARPQRLSINMSLLSPSSPSVCPSMSSSPSSASYSSCSSAVSSPASAFSPILNPFQWTSDKRQYIMTDIGPQPSNSQVLCLRSQTHLVRQRSHSKIGGPRFVTLPLSSGSTGSEASSPQLASLQTQELAQVPPDDWRLFKMEMVMIGVAA
ncbi:hypothetical protein EDD21DRAFT_414430 [Dissophora ornata]|nr:hypothetical protein EDD21DRAFT_414430 [Dissophora ornata]